MNKSTKPKMGAPRKDFPLDEAIKLYAGGQTLKEIGKKYGVSYSTVRVRLDEAGVTIRVPGGGAVRLRNGATDWQNVVLPRAVDILNSYSTPVTLRQLYYRIVSEQLIENTEREYRMFSRQSAEWRRDGRMGDLLDYSGTIDDDRGFDSPRSALDWLTRVYSRDRSEGQEYAIYVVCEKRGQSQQLQAWFGGKCIPIVSLGGWGSQTLERKLAKHVHENFCQRTAVVLYAGDFDCDGVVIERSFKKRVEDELGYGIRDWERVVLDSEQVEEYELPENPGKEKSSNAAGFVEEYGTNVQVELDALDPDVLHQLFEDAIEPYWDDGIYDAVLEQEQEERETLARLL